MVLLCVISCSKEMLEELCGVNLFPESYFLEQMEQ